MIILTVLQFIKRAFFILNIFIYLPLIDNLVCFNQQQNWKNNRNMAVFLTVASYAFIALISYLIYLVHFQYTYWKKRGMLYIKPMPIFGNTAPVFFRTSSYPDYLLQLYRTYSDVRYFGFFHFGVPLVMVKDADLLREILVKNFDHFVNHKAFITEQMDPVIGRNLFTLEDQRWRDVRSKLIFCIKHQYNTILKKLFWHFKVIITKWIKYSSLKYINFEWKIFTTHFSTLQINDKHIMQDSIMKKYFIFYMKNHNVKFKIILYVWLKFPVSVIKKL